MSMIEVKVEASRVEADFGTLPDRLRRLVHKRVSDLTTQLADRVRRKLSGEVLQVRSGDLRASFDQDVQDNGDQIVGKVFQSKDVPYARIHEYGGTINIPSRASVDPRKGATRAYTIHMPERSYLRSSLAEMRSEIIESLASAVSGPEIERS
jgi:phage gpG-like protein